MLVAPGKTFWLHVHPEYLVDEAGWEAVRLARMWREGVLPEPGGLADQAALTVAVIETVLSAWAKLQAERDKRWKDRTGGR